jgi:diketogulonate reductase-like aldo/keto reductase
VLAAVAGIEIAPAVAVVAAGPQAVVPPSIAASDAVPPQVQVAARPQGPAQGIDRRTVGRAGFAIAPLVISGAFDLSPAALATAAEAGVDAWFWEPGYDSLTEHLRARRREPLHVITGSYHADAASIDADVDRALRRLRRDALDIFLLFWSRSPARVDAEAFAMLDRLKRAGKIRAAGFSTHHRELARAAIEASPWDVVMIRHSAAHPGIEAELLPAARQTGTAILTFSALCYGRMVSGPGAPSPADCYRYSLSQPGVAGCISAPRRRRELIENLAALRSPILDAAQLAVLRAHGVGVRAENQRFNTLLRQPTRDAAAAARELLAAELPPGDEIQIRPLPRASHARGARTGLGTTRRRR